MAERLLVGTPNLNKNVDLYRLLQHKIDTPTATSNVVLSRLLRFSNGLFVFLFWEGDFWEMYLEIPCGFFVCVSFVLNFQVAIQNHLNDAHLNMKMVSHFSLLNNTNVFYNIVTPKW